LSRFHRKLPIILAPGEEKQALSPLPIEALRIDGETSATLRRLGFKTIGTLIDRPRAPFAARFDAQLLTRLDQALGLASEPLVFILPPALYHARRQLLEPVSHQDACDAGSTASGPRKKSGTPAQTRQMRQTPITSPASSTAMRESAGFNCAPRSRTRSLVLA
jgi:hypothetical protein